LKSQPTPILSDELLTTAQVAELCGLSQSTLRKWRCIGEGPRFARMGRAVRYLRSELAAFLAHRLYESTAQADGAEALRSDQAH